MSDNEFEAFPKLARLTRPCIVTEKIDGTNAQIIVTDDGRVLAGSRNRLITPGDDNYGFAKWVYDNAGVLKESLGVGRHFGEWWGAGIQRKYGLTEKRFSLFNTSRWKGASLPLGITTTPILYEGDFSTNAVDDILLGLKAGGSWAAPGFMSPEGVVVFHVASNTMFKKTLDGDGHKGAK